MILYRKSREEIEGEARRALIENTPITNISAGSRAYAMVRIFSDMLANYYGDLDANMQMAYVSKARGEFLDMIGELVDVHRIPGETEEQFRYRITHKLEMHQGATEEAIRLAALSVDTVREVILRPYTRGTGSGSVFVITHSMNDLEMAIPRVQEAIDQVTGFGMRVVAEAPRLLPVRMQLILSLKSGVPESARPSIMQSVRLAIKAYVDALALGETLLISRLFDEAMDADSRIYDIEIANLWIRDRAVLVQNQKARWDEKFYVEFTSDIEVS